MKNVISILLAGSIAASVLLLGILFAGYGGADEAMRPSVVSKTPAPAAKPEIDSQTWTNFQADDLPTMVQRLRERGVPPEFLRAIMMAQLRELYAPRMKALDPDAEKKPFWKSYTIDPKVQAAQMQLHREQQKALQTLLGPDAEPADTINALHRGVRFESVPSEKIPEVQRLLREFEDARNDIYSSGGGGMIGPDLQKRVEALQKEQQVALSRILTP